MERKGGQERKKVVFQEPGRSPVAITGEISDEGDFLVITNPKGSLSVAKRLVLTIKNASEGRE